jgi:hypothetical protein
MGDDRIRETIEIDCQEAGRRARLMVEWKQDGDRRTLVGVQCDNPRFHALEPWECHWSCWEKVKQAAAEGEPED